MAEENRDPLLHAVNTLANRGMAEFGAWRRATEDGRVREGDGHWRELLRASAEYERLTRDGGVTTLAPGEPYPEEGP